MKRILIIFMGLILGCNLASAKSVNCWEEMATTWDNTEPVSKMQSSLGADVTITRVSSMYRVATFIAGSSGFTEANLYSNSPVYYTSGSNKYYISSFSPLYYKSSSLSYMPNYIYIWSGNSGQGYFTPSLMIFHTYCIVDEGSSGGGGGGGATGSVNFIIKATS